MGRVAIFLLSVAVVSAFLGSVSARRYSKCSFATLLEGTYGMSRNDVKRFTCIAQYESGFNTATVSRPNRNGSKDYGIFQINDKYWCQGDIFSYNYCGISCSSLVNGDISSSVSCARTIARRQGYTAWVAYRSRCQQRDLDAYMAECWTRSG